MCLSPTLRRMFPGFNVSAIAPWLAPYSSGTGCVQCSSLHRPASQNKSLVTSDIATYSTSQVLSALISCLRDAFDSTLPSIMVTYALMLLRFTGALA
ncbi:hypothetical protein PHMEG_0009804 [Phytophthora megakarya]|uniref:Uncharacterized protein n=1 Tax=Phytophthora megakarya TaxID=4795 RepID=A0A225WH00_9STRA|nr:hypothetical protein PHMEG_0009804 [Phytophthora megakarya]